LKQEIKFVKEGGMNRYAHGDSHRDHLPPRDQKDEEEESEYDDEEEDNKDNIFLRTDEVLKN
jgi:hypothetical protein